MRYRVRKRRFFCSLLTCATYFLVARHLESSEVTVCIPSMFLDYESGDLARALLSIRNQRVRPVSVIVAMSEVPVTRMKDVKKSLGRIIAPVTLKLALTGKLQSPGENRNRALVLATGSIISFFDADDLMHPDRIRVLNQMFRTNPNLQLALHGLTSPTDDNLGKADVKYVQKLRGHDVCKIERQTRQAGQLWLSSNNLTYEITHGHVTLRKQVADRFQYGSGDVGEDCKYVRAIIQHLCLELPTERTTILDFPFTIYTPRKARNHQGPRQLPVDGV